MASKKLSTDTSLANSYKLSRGVASVARPSAPTIGTATDGGTGNMSVTFTASTLGPTASSFALTSSSGVTGSGASSPLTLQEVATGTYTYSVGGVNANGTGPSSAASNSVVVANLFAPSGAYDSIATATVSSPVSSITFSSIPSTYQHLQIRITGRGGRALFLDNPVFKFNSDSTTSNYYQHAIYGDGATVTAGASGTDYILAYSLAGDNAGSNVFGAMVVDILDYANTSKNKTVRALGGVDNNGQGIIGFGSGGWFSTSAINNIGITLSTGASFQQYTSAALYGIKGN